MSCDVCYAAELFVFLFPLSSAFLRGGGKQTNKKKEFFSFSPFLTADERNKQIAHLFFVFHFCMLCSFFSINFNLK